MKNTFLKRPYINITNENGRIIGNGANQGWFSNSPWFNVSGQGCGIISALDTLFYINGNRIITKADYQQAILDFAKNIVFTKLFMHEFFGKFAIGLTPLQITIFLNKKLGTGYKVTYNGRYGHEDMLTKMEDQLQADLPVIWSLYRPRKRITLYTYKSVPGEYIPATTTNSHYVNAIAVIHDAAPNHHTMIKLSSWGKIYFIDYDEYLAYTGNSIISAVTSNIFLIKKLQ